MADAASTSDISHDPNDYHAGADRLKQQGLKAEAAALLLRGQQQFPEDQSLPIARAWILYEIGDLNGAAALWKALRQRFPESVHGYVGGGATCRRALAFDEADTVYRAALERFSDNEVLLSDFAWSADERQNFSEAIRRWQSVLARFPQNTVAGIRLVELSKLIGPEIELGIPSEQRMPPASEGLNIAIIAARSAQERHDLAEALRRWEAIATHFPHLPEGRIGTVQVLMDLGRYSEAQQQLTPALRLFPDNETIIVLSGWLATHQRDTARAESIWADVRTRFPARIDGYLGYGRSLRDVGRLDNAELVLRDGARRFPYHGDIAIDLAQLAERRRDWPLAILRWREIAFRFPALPTATIGLAEALSSANDAPAAERVIHEGLQSFPQVPELYAAQARLAARRSLPEATRLWTAMRERFPHSPIALLGLGRTLCDRGHYAQSCVVLEAALTQFPNDLELEVQLATTWSQHRDWPKAMALWDSLKSRYPGSSEVRYGISQILDHALRDQEQGIPIPFEIPPAVLANGADEGENIKALSQLLKRFDSLGDDCQFGMVQRLFQADPVSLLRWTSTSPEALAMALEMQLEGVGDPENTIVEIHSGEYVTLDRRYYMFSHTFTRATSEPIEEFAIEQCRRIRWLRRKLLEELAEGTRIYVYKHKEGISDIQIDVLHAALCRFHPGNVLLCVRLANSEHPSSFLEARQNNLFIGYVDRFSTVDISAGAWVDLCQQVVGHLSRIDNESKAI